MGIPDLGSCENLAGCSHHQSANRGGIGKARRGERRESPEVAQAVNAGMLWDAPLCDGNGPRSSRHTLPHGLASPKTVLEGRLDSHSRSSLKGPSLEWNSPCRGGLFNWRSMNIGALCFVDALTFRIECNPSDTVRGPITPEIFLPAPPIISRT